MHPSLSSSSRAPLMRDELLQVRWLLGGALTLISALSVGYAEIDAGLLLGVIVAGVLLTLARPELPGRIPRWAHRLVFPAVAAVLAGDLWLRGEVLPALVRLDLLLLLYRGVTYRKKRDDLQLVVLGLFLVVVAGVLTVSPLFAVHILVFTACALGLLLVVTLSPEEGTERDKDQVASIKDQVTSIEGRGASGEGGGVPGWAREVRWGRLLRRWRAATDWRVVALGGGLFAGLVALSALLFLAMPRFQWENSLWLDRFMSRSAKTGFSDTIRLGDVTDIQQDNAVAVNVDVPDRSRIAGAPYWRMLVLDDYRDGTFRLSPELLRSAFGRERSEAGARGGGRRETGAPAYWTFYLEAEVSRYLPLLGPFGRLQFREPQHFRLSGALGVVALRDEPVTMTAYRVEDMTNSPTMADTGFAGRLRERARNPRAAMLALELEEADRATLERIDREIAAGTENLSAGEFAQRAGAWLARRHTYSLKPRIPAGTGDPLVRWMTGEGGGHCELFAGSLVLLARAAGWPARLVTGFHGGTWNAYSNNYTLRNSDAHAWCELYDAEQEAWVRADPTPGAVVVAEEGREATAWAGRTDRSWTARFDSLRVFWYRRIVSFDHRAQQDALDAVKAATRDSGEWLRAAWVDMGVRFDAWLRAPWNGRRASVWLGAALALAGGLWAGWRFRFSIAEAMPGTRRRDPVRAAAGRWLARVRAQAEGGVPEAAAVIADLQRLRYGARETWPEPMEVFHRARRASRRRRGEAATPK